MCTTLHCELHLVLPHKLQRRWGGQKVQLNRGCPQGSVLGVTLWVILYDAVIRNLEEQYPDTCVYADDTFIVVTTETAAQLKERVEECIRVTNAKLQEIGLELSIGKSEVHTLIRTPLWKRADVGLPAHYHFKVNGTILYPRDCVRYLGVQVNNKLRFMEHIVDMVERCKKRIPLLVKLCKNTYRYE